MITDEEFKEAIIQYVREHYEHYREAPSLGEIIRHFEGEKLSFSRFYKVFPKGMSEVCTLAGVPVPTERMKRTAKAIRAGKNGRQVAIMTQGTQVPSRVEEDRKNTFPTGPGSARCPEEDWPEHDGASNSIWDDLLDLKARVAEVEKYLMIAFKMVKSLDAVCPECGNKLVLWSLCTNCQKDYTITLNVPTS